MKYPQSYPRPRCEFDRAFLFHVWPRLNEAATFGGALVHYNLELFSDAVARVMAVAVRCGATHLSRATFDELESWAASLVLDAVEAKPPAWLISPDRLARITGEHGNEQRRYGGKRR